MRSLAMSVNWIWCSISTRYALFWDMDNMRRGLVQLMVVVEDVYTF